MKKRGVIRSRKRMVVSHRSNRRTGFSVRPGLVIGGIVAVIVLISLANWLYRTGAFASTAGVTQAQLFTDATALIAQSNADIQSVAQMYENEISRMQVSYEAEIDDLNERIDAAIAAESVTPLTSGVAAPTQQDLTQTETGIPDESTTEQPVGFWARVGQFFANLFS